jgi:hypothetical protein
MKTLIIILLISFLLSGCSSEAVDERLFMGSPETLICQEEDLPGFYFLIEDLSGPRPNNELVINPDEPSASDQYIALTGRISGWEHRFMLGEFSQTLPGFILCQVVLYESIDGANHALHWPHDEAREIIESERQIGDEMLLTVMAFDAPDGSPWIDHRVEFTHLNLLGAASSYTPVDLASPDYVLDLAEVLYQRMLDATP